MKSKYCIEISGGRLWTITQDTEKCSIVILDLEMVRKCDIVQCFEFFDEEIIQQIVRETNRCAEQYKNARGNLFSSSVRSWTPATESEIYIVLGLFLLMGIV